MKFNANTKPMLATEFTEEKQIKTTLSVLVFLNFSVSSVPSVANFVFEFLV